MKIAFINTSTIFNKNSAVNRTQHCFREVHCVSLLHQPLNLITKSSSGSHSKTRPKVITANCIQVGGLSPPLRYHFKSSSPSHIEYSFIRMVFHPDFASPARFAGNSLLYPPPLCVICVDSGQFIYDDEHTGRPYLNANSEVPGGIPGRALVLYEWRTPCAIPRYRMLSLVPFWSVERR